MYPPSTKSRPDLSFNWPSVSKSLLPRTLGTLQQQKRRPAEIRFREIETHDFVSWLRYIYTRWGTGTRMAIARRVTLTWGSLGDTFSGPWVYECMSVANDRWKANAIFKMTTSNEKNAKEKRRKNVRLSCLGGHDLTMLLIFETKPCCDEIYQKIKCREKRKS